ncbi:MAG: hypothetical protein JW774_08330 [Candidatus Aureabacteria bacterium]|nr:hypothetical protein [Candidatus Auribacterota bacterium]
MRTILFIIMMYFGFLMPSHSAILIAVKVSSFEEFENHIGKMAGPSMGPSWRAWWELQMTASLGHAWTALDRTKPLYAVWVTAMTQQPSLWNKPDRIVFVPSIDPSSMLSSVSPPLLGKKMPGGICAFSESQKALADAETLLQEIQRDIPSRSGTGLFAKIHVEHIWNEYRQMIYLLKGMAFFTLSFSEVPALQRQFNQFLEGLLWVIDSLSVVIFHASLQTEENNQTFSFRFTFKEGSPFLSVIPGPSPSSQQLFLAEKPFSSIAGVLNPMRMSLFLRQYIDRMFQLYAITSEEARLLRTSTARIFGGKDTLPSSTLFFKSAASISELGDVQATIAISREKRRISLAEFKDRMKRLFYNTPFRCEAVVSADSIKTVRMRIIPKQNQASAGWPFLMVQAVRIFLKKEPEIHFTFQEEAGAIVGCLGDNIRPIIATQDLISPPASDSFLRFQMNYPYFLEVIQSLKEGKELSDKSAVRTEKEANLIVIFSKIDKGFKMDISLPDSGG